MQEALQVSLPPNGKTYTVRLDYPRIEVTGFRHCLQLSRLPYSMLNALLAEPALPIERLEQSLWGQVKGLRGMAPRVSAIKSVIHRLNVELANCEIPWSVSKRGDRVLLISDR